jgi:hypothetical protein
MITLQHTRIANKEQIADKKQLEWDQYPAITPFPRRLSESQEKEKAITHDIVRNMTGRKAIVGIDVMDTDAIFHIWTWTCHKWREKEKETPCTGYSHHEKQGLPPPSQ